MPISHSYQEYHRKLIDKLAEDIKKSPPFNSQTLDEFHTEFLEKLDILSASDSTLNNTQEIGQWLLMHIVSNFQYIMPKVPRNLFWFFGGDCLHYLGDEEIAFFQRVDEVYHEQTKNDKGDALTYEQILASAETQKMLH